MQVRSTNFRFTPDGTATGSLGFAAQAILLGLQDFDTAGSSVVFAV
jgi:hypothetical protein